MTAWEKLLPMLDFSFLCRHSKPPLSAVQPPPFYPCSLLQVFFPFFFFSSQTCQLRHHCHLHLASPSHRRYPVTTAINPVSATSTLQLLHQPCGHYNCCHVTPCGHTNYPLHWPSHVLQAHTSHPTAIALAAPSAPKKAPDKSFPFFFLLHL